MERLAGDHVVIRIVAIVKLGQNIAAIGRRIFAMEQPLAMIEGVFTPNDIGSKSLNADQIRCLEDSAGKNRVVHFRHDREESPVPVATFGDAASGRVDQIGPSAIVAHFVLEEEMLAGQVHGGLAHRPQQIVLIGKIAAQRSTAEKCEKRIGFGSGQRVIRIGFSAGMTEEGGGASQRAPLGIVLQGSVQVRKVDGLRLIASIEVRKNESIVVAQCPLREPE